MLDDKRDVEGRPYNPAQSPPGLAPALDAPMWPRNVMRLYGAGNGVADVLADLADCPKRGRYSDPCQAVYANFVAA